MTEFAPRRDTLESQGAAMLLLKLKSLAADEFQSGAKAPLQKRRPRLIPQESSHTIDSCYQRAESDSEYDDEEPPHLLAVRIRTVSVCSGEVTLGTMPHSPDSQGSRAEGTPSPQISSDQISFALLSDVLTKPPSSKIVGTTTEAPLKGILKRKFSWKNYPKLEGYLVEHREQYLRYSSQLNYTAEQKHYNNKLTQGLLELASEEGYIFEDFTFAAIRDRIRCYYKSCVQAEKKKKRKKRA